MTRTEYLAQLDKYLKKLPRRDYQEAMDYFTEYFNEVGPDGEAAAMADLGSPKEAAHEIMVNLLDKKIEEDGQENSSPRNTRQIIQIAILSILAAPLAIPLFLVVLVLVSVFFLLILVLTLALAILTLALFVVAISFIWDALTLGLAAGIPGFLLTLGISILSLGLACLCALSITPLLQFAKFSFVKLAQIFAQKGVRHEKL